MAENPTTANPEAGPRTGAQEEREINVTPRIMMQAGGYYMLLLRECERRFTEILGDATKQGYDTLMNGGTAVDAVEKAVCILEESPYFNAGRGSFLNRNGEVECDAMIMDGSTMKTGAVMAVRHFKHPITISRKIMEESVHCAFSGDGALAFAREKDLDICEPEDLITEYARSVKDTFIYFLNTKVEVKHPGEHDEITGKITSDTISAVALDKYGHFACATSTGGLPGKAKGRISDAPLAGCGGYANEFGAAAAGGHGESLIKMTLAREVVFNMEKLEQDAQSAAKNAVQDMERRINGYGGAIAIDKNGNFGRAANTSIMIWASMADKMLEVGLEGRKKFN